ncbi:unnamed protein product [Callosobruchus maculatus]|uniref:Uncharacterized protein n=1 Tax=Callosobruchus maculatus TaxID=64391 RepID=A0A653DS83_CALMS|nr:unnamed protein product [Callosobruchus maculatus]
MRTPLTLPANRGACGKLRANHASTAGLRAPIPTSRNFIEIVWEARILFTGYYVVNFFCEYCADREVCVTALPRQDKDGLPAPDALLASGAPPAGSRRFRVQLPERHLRHQQDFQVRGLPSGAAILYGHPIWHNLRLRPSSGTSG